MRDSPKGASVVQKYPVQNDKTLDPIHIKTNNFSPSIARFVEQLANESFGEKRLLMSLNLIYS